MSNKYWTLDFVITRLIYIEDSHGLYYTITFRDDEGVDTKVTFNPGEDKYLELYKAACGYSPQQSTSKSPEGDLLGRVVKGTLFENEDRQGRVTYNVAYFKEADKSRLCDLFFQKPQEFWTEQRMNEFKNRMSYVEYVKETFRHDLHESLIQQAIENGKIE